LGWGSEADERLAALATYGAAVGKAFQIADDVLNATAAAETLGKPVGSDAALQKSTYVALYGVDRSRETAAELTGQALAALEPFGAAAEPLRLLCRYAVERER
jgi:geranylgeranyl pyrophosphate synthase